MNRLHDDDDFGFDLDFITEPIEDAGKFAINTAGSIVEAVPGGSLVTGAVSDFVTGPLRDFAKTPIGEVILRSISVAMSHALYVVPAVGYTLGFLAWSVPGLAKGQRFNEAMVKEFVYRVEAVVSYFLGQEGGKYTKEFLNKQMGDQLQKAVTDLTALSTKTGLSPQALVAKTGLTPAAYAKMLGIREDMAAFALQWYKGGSENVLKLLNKAYDPSGRLKPAVQKALQTMNMPPDSPCAKLEALKSRIDLNKLDSFPAERAAYLTLSAQCEEYQLTQAINIANIPDPNAGHTLGKRVKGASGSSGLNPVQLYQAAVKRGQSMAVLASLRAKAEAWQKEQDAVAAKAAAQSNTMAGAAAATYTPGATADSADAAVTTEENKKSAIAGAITGFVGTGGALLAGLSAGIAIPVGLGFAAGGAAVTKILNMRNRSAG